MPSSDTQFKKGHKRSKGRPKGSRDKLTTAYLKLLAVAEAEHGKQAIDKVALTKPDVLLKLLGALVPKDLDVKHSGDVTVQVVDYQDEDDGS